jgi:type 1 fimbriae regulatory protein FimB/type 1 fimbriae regulatory protein FimE
MKRKTNLESREREWMYDQEVRKLVKAAAKMGRWGHRNATLILIGYRHGMRASELIDLRWELINLDEQTLYCRRLKGSKNSQHTLERDEIAALKKLGHQRTGYVFLSERGQPLSRRTVCHIVAEAGKLANLPFTVHPHMLRHSCGFNLTAAGHPTRMIQDWLGHVNIMHTVHYTELDPNRFREGGRGMWSRR